MIWDLQVLPRAEKALTKLDKPQARRIRDGLVRLSRLDDPATACKALGGPLTLSQLCDPVRRYRNCRFGSIGFAG